MINKKFLNNNYNDKKQLGNDDIILQWLAFQKQENEDKIHSSNTQILNKYYKISIDCIDSCTDLIEHYQNLQKVYEEISKKIGILEKKHRETKVRLEKEILFLNIENWKTIRKKIKTELDRSNVY
ncbi:MAG TPA: hypothetical protein VFT83_04285 [Nitrososphaeraceae archaeon]|nr:hypothetical protein [Nitrososphaeraceae archaeon]HEU5172727.1 hypothetical protein [Nitrososphaeraceae archaeon]